MVRPVPARPADPDSHSPRPAGRAPWQKARTTHRFCSFRALVLHSSSTSSDPMPFWSVFPSLLISSSPRRVRLLLVQMVVVVGSPGRCCSTSPRCPPPAPSRPWPAGRPGAAPDQGAQEQGGGARGHGRNAQAPGGRVRPLGGPREVLALRRYVSDPPLHLLLLLICGSLLPRVFLSTTCLHGDGRFGSRLSCHSFRILQFACACDCMIRTSQ